MINKTKNINEELENIIDWTKVKIRLHLKSTKKLYFSEREIWWASMGANIGCEQNGKNLNFERPVVILKRFGRASSWIVPLSSKDKKGSFYYSYFFEGKKYSANLSQLKLISSKRLIRKIGTFPEDDFLTIKIKLKRFL